MPNTYAYGIGHGLADDELSMFPLQPFSKGPQYPERVFAVDGTPHEQGASFIELVFGPDLTIGQATDIMARLTLDKNEIVDITLRAPASSIIRSSDWVRYNARVFRPRLKDDFDYNREKGAFKEFTVTGVELEEIA